MIDSTDLMRIVEAYAMRCQDTQHKPEYQALAVMLGISARTIKNVLAGAYNGTEYGDKPSCNRCICNDDFQIIREVFRHKNVMNQEFM